LVNFFDLLSIKTNNTLFYLGVAVQDDNKTLITLGVFLAIIAVILVALLVLSIYIQIIH